MEEWQEEISETKYLYFTAKADFKYRGKLDFKQSENSKHDFFYLKKFFGVKLYGVKSLPSLEEYELNKKELPLLADNYDLEKDKTFFELKPDEIFITEWKNIEHVQVEGDEVYGHFTKVPVVFRLQRIKKKIICREGFETGKTEIRDGINFVEYYHADCTLDWKPKCIQGKPTGNKESEEKRFRLEYSNSDCTTYWGEWISIIGPPPSKTCVQDKWTSKSRRTGNWIQREYTNLDCTTYWKDYEEIKPPGPGGGCVDGCMSLLGLIPFLLLIFLLISLFTNPNGNEFAILFVIALLILIFGLRYFTGILGRFPWIRKYFPYFLQWLFSLIAFMMIITALNTIIKNFKNFSFDSTSKRENNSQSSEIIPVKRSHHDIDTTITDSTIREKIKVKLSWNGFDGQNYKGVYYLYMDDVVSSSTTLYRIGRNNPSYSELYQKLANNDSRKFEYLYHMLDSIKTEHSQNEWEFTGTIVYMIQSIEYCLVLESNCDDPANLQNKMIRDILAQNFQCIGGATLGIRSPLQFMSDLKGDCDTRTLTLYTIFKHYGYNVAIINSEYYGHSMLGISLPIKKGTYKIYNGKKYYFWETTSTGFLPGYLPFEMGNTNYWNVEIN